MKAEINNFQLAADDFKKAIESVVLSQDVYKDGWNASQIISHVIFYQEYYTSIVAALVNQVELPLIDESLAKVNIRSAQKFAGDEKAMLILTFSAAQQTFIKNMQQINPNKNIPYKKGGKIYTAKAYLVEITRHLIRHTKDLQRKKRSIYNA